MPPSKTTTKHVQMHKCAGPVHSHTAGKWGPKRAVRLPFCTCCTSYWSQTAPLPVNGETLKRQLTCVPNGWPASIWQTASKRGSSIAIGDIATSIERANSADKLFFLPMIIPGSAVRQQRLACDWRMGTGAHVDFSSSSIGTLSSPAG